MINSSGGTYQDHIIPVSLKDCRGFIANSLKSSGWDGIQTPRRLSKITAVMQDNIDGMVKRRNIYSLTIRYSKADDESTRLDYELKKQGLQTVADVKVKQILSRLVETIEGDARQFATSKAQEELPDTFGSARFATEAELEAAGYITTDTEAERLLLCPYGDDSYLTIPKAQTCQHALICGPTGAGKSSGFFIPNIIKRHRSSAIVTEATAGDEIPELYENTAGWRAFKRNKIYFFNPGFAKGTRINPLDKARFAPPGELAMVADELAQLVIINTSPPTSQRGDPIWDKAEKHLLWVLIMDAVTCGDPEKAHFGAIRQLLRQPEQIISAALASTNCRIAQEEFDSFINHSSDNFRHGVFSGLLQRLNPWLTERVVTMTKTTDLDIDQLKNELFTFYLSVPSRKLSLKPIGALVFNFLLDLALQTRFKHPLALILDEFTNFGAIPGIDDTLSIIRKRDLPVVLGVQNLGQIKKIYGLDATSNIVSMLATRVIFRPRHRETALDISKELDTTTIVKEETDDNGRTSVREYGKPLMSVADLMTMPDDEVVIMLPNCKPVRMKRFTWQTFPSAKAYDCPEQPEHRLVTPTVAPEIPQEVIDQEVVVQEAIDQEAMEAKKVAKITETERDFYKERDKLGKRFEKQRKDKKKAQVEEVTQRVKVATVVDEDDWDVPG